MIEISIIVQVREVAGDGRKGRIAVGFSKLLTENLVPHRGWCENFFAACRRAARKREEHLEEIAGIATAVNRRRRVKEVRLPLFEEPF